MVGVGDRIDKYELREHIELGGLLYQWVDRGVAIHLISRHVGDPHREFERRRLGSLFDSVINVTDGGSQASYIAACEGRPIFIDDSFGERRDVGSRCGIPTYDCSMIEVLADDSS